MQVIIENILDMIENGGENELLNDLSAFSSPLNPEIEEFIRSKAIDFAKRKLSITYLVNDLTDGNILGYFTLTHKSIIVSDTNLSSTARRKLARYSRMDKVSGNYMASAFLLAQFGKNYGVDGGRRISGAELMQLASDVLVSIQRQIGGGIVYLDCEDKPELISFYTDQNFKRFDDRFSSEDDQKYIQFMRFF